MRFNFRKVSAIGASVLLAGMSMGVAAAAAYPQPFVVGGAAQNVAIVYGADAHSLDIVEAGNIQANLATYVTDGTTGSTTSGGDTVLLERTSDKLNMGNNAATVFVTSVDEDDMPTLLADGTYTDDDNTDYDYTQKITLGSNLGIEHFWDSDHDDLIGADDKTPSLGIQLGDDEHVLNYTIDFTTHPAYNATVMETTDLALMGKSYYVLDVVGVGDSTTNQNKTTLLDAANAGIVSDEETASIAGKDVSISFISSSEVRLDVDGETTNSLAEGATFKLSDDTYVGIKDIMYSSKEGVVSKVEISIGTGKLELTHGSEIELNDNTIQEIKAFMIQDSSYKLDKIVLQWTTDDEEFISVGNELTMPGFEAIKFTLGGFIAPESEETTVENNGNDVIVLKTTINSGEIEIPLLQTNSTGSIQLIGKDSTNRLASRSGNFLFFNETSGEKYLVASWNSSTEAESYYLKIEMITDDNVNKVRFTDEVTNDYKTVTNASDASFGSVSLTVLNVTRDGSKKWANISINDGGSFNTLYTAEGMRVYLPWFPVGNRTGADNGTFEGILSYNESDGTEMGHVWVSEYGIYNGTFGTDVAGSGHVSYYQWFAEEDKNGILAGGKDFNVTITESGTSDKIHISAIDTASTVGKLEIDDTDNFEEYSISDFATKLVHYTGGDQDTVKITYSGDQSYAELYLAAPGATVTSTTATTALGDVLFTDAELTSVAAKNVVVVGGSCINAAAASLVGGAYCGADWTDATDVGAGEFLIKGYATSDVTSEFALLVAGYEAADTVNAAKYLRTQKPDTAKAWKGTTATAEATEIVEA